MEQDATGVGPGFDLSGRAAGLVGNQGDQGSPAGGMYLEAEPGHSMVETDAELDAAAGDGVAQLGSRADESAATPAAGETGVLGVGWTRARRRQPQERQRAWYEADEKAAAPAGRRTGELAVTDMDAKAEYSRGLLLEAYSGGGTW